MFCHDCEKHQPLCVKVTIVNPESGEVLDYATLCVDHVQPIIEAGQFNLGPAYAPNKKSEV